ncbi:N-acetylmuramic acid 6-phosphate phosphatase [Sinobacterium norvegicum]|uniref:N-acetylmuramic acid 6-phosphate phosphatase n=1 Tax=Sinobacterium norvegicum TaxID=1641715 RepID=A0ABM9ACR7_9GAMM|nr:HAD-IA family hydrolase [Sinobacterium norvegicum]CAH0990765.1 N-acetylmuramic acid 6-phosphate phosphatase [Sinobacterium norvegicum]
MSRLPLAAVLFDLDGTVLDTAKDFEWVLNQQLATHQRESVSYEKLRSVVSHGARAMVSLGFDIQQDAPGFEALRQEFLALYQQHLCHRSKLFDGMQEVLDWCVEQRLPMAIVTNKPSTFTLALLDKLELSHYFTSVVCPDDVSQAKPSPEPLLLAAEQLQVNAKQCLYIGDHIRDIDAGRAANMSTMACRYGYIEDDDSADNWLADMVIDHPLEIIQHCQQQLSALLPE